MKVFPSSLVLLPSFQQKYNLRMHLCTAVFLGPAQVLPLFLTLYSYKSNLDSTPPSIQRSNAKGHWGKYLLIPFPPELFALDKLFLNILLEKHAG